MPSPEARVTLADSGKPSLPSIAVSKSPLRVHARAARLQAMADVIVKLVVFSDFL